MSSSAKQVLLAVLCIICSRSSIEDTIGMVLRLGSQGSTVKRNLSAVIDPGSGRMGIDRCR